MTAPLPALPPLALYVHVPWCERKCPYCDFNSHAVRGAQIPERAYVDALLRDIELELPLANDRELISLFIGGGTPSLLSPEAIHRLLEGVRRVLHMAQDIEITLEANPGTVERGRFQAYREAGLNRLSIGVQSFTDSLLQRLGRIHDADAARRAAEAACSAGFDDFNLDLMFGLPGQRQEESEADLRTAIGLGPTHISFYQLTLEPNTEFAIHPPNLPDDDHIWAMQAAGQALLANAGFHQYEISAFARDGHQCRHNRNYWEFGDYLAIGAGAHGKYTLRDPIGILRRTRRRHPRAYLDAMPDLGFISEERRIAQEELPFEFMLNALRLTEGVPSAWFTERTGLDAQWIEPVLRRARADDLMDADPSCLRPSPMGRRFLNDLLQRFLPDA